MVDCCAMAVMASDKPCLHVELLQSKDKYKKGNWDQTLGSVTPKEELQRARSSVGSNMSQLPESRW